MEATVSNPVRLRLGRGAAFYVLPANCEMLKRLFHSAEIRQKESSVGSGRVDGGSLAGKESARVLSNIFSRVARASPASVERSSGSRVGSVEITGFAVLSVSTLHT